MSEPVQYITNEQGQRVGVLLDWQTYPVQQDLWVVRAPIYQMPSIGAHCHELRIRDQDKNWRVLYRIDDDVVLIVEVFHKTTRTTPKTVIETCQKRLARYDRDQQE